MDSQKGQNVLCTARKYKELKPLAAVGGEVFCDTDKLFRKTIHL